MLNTQCFRIYWLLIGKRNSTPLGGGQLKKAQQMLGLWSFMAGFIAGAPQGGDVDKVRSAVRRTDGKVRCVYTTLPHRLFNPGHSGRPVMLDPFGGPAVALGQTPRASRLHDLEASLDT
jgi:hypothetical protein